MNKPILHFIKCIPAIFLILLSQILHAQNNKPNIILILADDIGYKALGCNGGNLYSTPNIDTLAQNGMRFTQCHSSPLCSPSRYAILTGKYNFRNYTNLGQMSPDEKTIGSMMNDAGYKTAFFGKDQLDGGAQSLNSWGFQDYCVQLPFQADSVGSRYKNPQLYTHEAYIPDSLTLNKYGPDIITDSMFSFIENNLSNPFFIYYPISLVHSPFSPTPDDTAFLNWDPKNSDTAFFPSMMKYMDKEVGLLINKIKELQLDSNTIIILTADNGTSVKVPDYDDEGSLTEGGKASTTEAGIHVPLVVSWPGKIANGVVNEELIDFTDFLPTIASIAEIPAPTTYGILDGVDFSPALFNQSFNPRTSLFYNYTRDPSKPTKDKTYRWAQNTTYKLYDTSSVSSTQLFYNIQTDLHEQNALPDSVLTEEELIIKQQLMDVINGYVAQGTALISLNPVLQKITDSSVVLTDTIFTNGTSTITACGAVWSTDSNPDINSNDHSTTQKFTGPFTTIAKGLLPNTTYYIRAYVTNYAGTVYSNQVRFTTPVILVAIAATKIKSNQFTANWQTFEGAESYQLDVSSSPTFTRQRRTLLTETFDNALTTPAGWTISGAIIANYGVYGAAQPALEFRESGARVTTVMLGGNATRLKFWIKGLSTNKRSSLLVEGYDGLNWSVVANIDVLPKAGKLKIFDATTVPDLKQNFKQFRFTYNKSEGTLAFDDVSIDYINNLPFLLPKYNNLPVSGLSQLVKPLTPATTYFYRIRAVIGDSITPASRPVEVTTSNSITAIQSQVVQKNIANELFGHKIFPNPGSSQFTLITDSKNSKATYIVVRDLYGKKVFETTGNKSNKYVFGKNFLDGMYFVNIIESDHIETIKIIKLSK